VDLETRRRMAPDPEAVEFLDGAVESIDAMWNFGLAPVAPRRDVRLPRHVSSRNRLCDAVLTLLGGLSIILCFAASGRAQSQNEMARIAQSPYEIERFVETTPAFEWEPLWRALNIQESILLPPCDMRSDEIWCDSSIPDRSVTGFVFSAQTQPEPRITVSYHVEFSMTLNSGLKFNLDAEPSLEEYLRYDLKRLKEIASGSDGPEKRWLRSFLRACPPSPEKRSLDQLLRPVSKKLRR
jgi:hypothetical protein